MDHHCRQTSRQPTIGDDRRCSPVYLRRSKLWSFSFESFQTRNSRRPRFSFSSRAFCRADAAEAHYKSTDRMRCHRSLCASFSASANEKIKWTFEGIHIFWSINAHQWRSFKWISSNAHVPFNPHIRISRTIPSVWTAPRMTAPDICSEFALPESRREKF